MKKLNYGLIIIITAIWVGLMSYFLISGTNAFVSELSGKTCDFENITFSDMQKNLIVDGRCYKIVECIVSSEIKDENGRILDYPERKIKYFNSYYYIIKTPDDSLMFMKTSVHSKLTDMSDKLLLAAMQEESPYADMLESGVPVDGILIDIDPAFIRFFKEWDSTHIYGLESLAPYVLDCTQPVFLRIIEFWVGVILLILFLIAAAIVIKKIHDDVKLRNYLALNTFHRSFADEMGGSSAPSYNPDETFSSANINITQSGFQAQGGQRNTADEIKSPDKSEPADTYTNNTNNYINSEYMGFQAQSVQENNINSAEDTYSSSGLGRAYGGFQTQSSRNNQSVSNENKTES